jgi:hypothetical protein
MTNVKVAGLGRVTRLAVLLATTRSPTEVEADAVAVAEQAAGKEAVTRTAVMQVAVVGCEGVLMILQVEVAVRLVTRTEGTMSSSQRNAERVWL